MRPLGFRPEPHGPQRNLGHRHPCGNQSPIFGVVAAPPATCTSTWCSPPTIAAACSTRRYSTGANSFIAQVCADFGATLAELNGEQDHVHLLAAYSPKVSLCHLVNSFNGVSSRRLRQDFTGRVNTAAMRGLFWPPSYFARLCGGPPLSTFRDLHHQPETTRLDKVSSLP